MQDEKEIYPTVSKKRGVGGLLKGSGWRRIRDVQFVCMYYAAGLYSIEILVLLPL